MAAGDPATAGVAVSAAAAVAVGENAAVGVDVGTRVGVHTGAAVNVADGSTAVGADVRVAAGGGGLGAEVVPIRVNWTAEAEPWSHDTTAKLVTVRPLQVLYVLSTRDASHD